MVRGAPGIRGAGPAGPDRRRSERGARGVGHGPRIRPGDRRARTGGTRRRAQNIRPAVCLVDLINSGCADHPEGRMTLWTELAGFDYTIRHVTVGPWSTRVLETGTGQPLILMHGTGGHLEA